MARLVSTNNYLTVGDVAAVDLTGNMTLAAWFWPVSFPGIGVVMGKDSGGEGGCQYIVGNNGSSVYFQIGTAGSGNQFGVAGGTLSASAWNHIAATLSSVTLTTYANGSFGASANAGFTPQNTAEPLYIGRRSNGQYPNGYAAECAIWNVALSAAEIASLGKGFSPQMIRPQSLVGYWPLHGNASPEPDLRNGNNGTISGSPTKNDHPRVIRPRPAIYFP